MITNINQLDLQRHYTYADYLTWRFKERVELLRGRIAKMSPAPSRKHQQVSGRLFGELYQQLSGSGCEIFSAPFDVRLAAPAQPDTEVSTVVQPDICIVCDAAQLDDKGCVGPPAFIAEVLSASTSQKDLHEKKALYAANGVPEYWVVHPTEGTVIVYLIENGDYAYHGIFTRGDTLPLATMPALSVELDGLFYDLEG